MLRTGEKGRKEGRKDGYGCGDGDGGKQRREMGRQGQSPDRGRLN